jgi:hypothetical protein
MRISAGYREFSHRPEEDKERIEKPVEENIWKRPNKKIKKGKSPGRKCLNSNLR